MNCPYTYGLNTKAVKANCTGVFHHELKRFVRFRFSWGIKKVCALLYKFSRSEKHVTTLSSFNGGIRYLTKRLIIARKQKRIWPSADKCARCDGIWPSTAELHDVKNLTERRQMRTMEFDRAQPNTWSQPKTLAHTHSRVKKLFERFFRSENFREKKKIN